MTMGFELYLIFSDITLPGPDTHRAKMARNVPFVLIFISVAFIIWSIADFLDLKEYKGSRKYWLHLARFAALRLFFLLFLLFWCVLYFGDPINQALLKS